METNPISAPAVSHVGPQVPREGNEITDRANLPRRQDDTQHGVLVHFEQARTALALASRIDEVKDIRDKAEAMRLYTRQRSESLEMQNMCAEIKLRAERRLGEMLAQQSMSERKNANLLRGRTVRPRDAGPSLAQLGITKSQSSRWQLMSRLPEDQFEQEIEYMKYTGRELTSNAILKQARYVQNEQTWEQKREAGRRVIQESGPNQNIRILHGDFRRVLVPPTLEPNSVDLILTDPPYLEQYLPLYGELSRFAATVLKPGRLVAAYCGNYHLAEIMRQLSRRLQYVWTLAVFYRNCNTQVITRRIKTGWKPIGLFSKGDYRVESGRRWMHDIIHSLSRIKENHDWEQPVAESEYLVEAMTFEGQLVVDPFMGSGTTGVACQKLNRRFVGSDVDEKAVEIATARLQQS